jgi:hypothetical protein
MQTRAAIVIAVAGATGRVGRDVGDDVVGLRSDENGGLPPSPHATTAAPTVEEQGGGELS